MNKVENAEIVSSGLYFMYKNNAHYDVCRPPAIDYINMTQNNLESRTQTSDPFTFEVVVKGYVYIKPTV